MKSHFYISIFLLVLFTSCASSRTASSEKLKPALYLEGEKINSVIINYEADYGIDSPDGDVLMGEIKIDIAEFVNKEMTLQINGSLTGIYINDSQEKLSNAPIKLLDGQRNKLKEFRSDSLGNFEIKFDYKTSYLLEFNYIGYRTLFVDLSKLIGKV